MGEACGWLSGVINTSPRCSWSLTYIPSNISSFSFSSPARCASPGPGPARPAAARPGEAGQGERARARPARGEAGAGEAGRRGDARPGGGTPHGNRIDANCACARPFERRTGRATPRGIHGSFYRIHVRIHPEKTREPLPIRGEKWLIGAESRASVVVYPEIGENKKGK